jgi:hypothetical protein
VFHETLYNTIKSTFYGTELRTNQQFQAELTLLSNR